MDRLPDCRCVLASDCVDDVQACKDSVEQDLMREASRINDLVMERAVKRLKEGVTEKEIAEYIVSQYAAEGCENESFRPSCPLDPMPLTRITSQITLC